MSNVLIWTVAITAALSTAVPHSTAQAARRGHITASIDISRVPSAPPAQMTRAEFTHEGVRRDYSMFSPPRTLSAPGPRPMIVLLHGCGQDAETFAKATRMNELAIRENAFVLYPEQSREANELKCWNWFDPANQTRDTGKSERAWMAALVDSVANAMRADRSKIFVAGLSAGGAMAVNMLSCHPDLFAAAGVFAGVPFAAAGAAADGWKVMRNGSPLKPRDSAAKAFACDGSKTGRPLPVFIAHGDADKVVAKTNARQILRHFEALNDLRDDGQANGSFVYKTVAIKTNRARKSVYGHSLESLVGPGMAAPARFVRIKKLGHVWSGGAPSSPHTDAKGPPAGDLMWEFFSHL